MIDDLCSIAVAIGGQLVQWRERGAQEGHWEGTQFKAQADALAHHAWLDALGRLAPEIPVRSEEDEQGCAAGLGDRYFLIDPLDGTASYAHGFPGFVTQVALIESARPRLAAVHAPVLGNTWHAESGKGAFLNGRQIAAISGSNRLLVVDNYPEPRGAAAALVRELPATGYVECGSIALKACLVADGTVDLFAKDVVVRDWDLAPCDLLLREAGCWISDSDGQPIKYDTKPEKNGVVVARDAQLAARALEILRQGRRS